MAQSLPPFVVHLANEVPLNGDHDLMLQKVLAELKDVAIRTSFKPEATAWKHGLFQDLYTVDTD